MQDITLAGHDLTISGGSTVTLPDLVDDADPDPTNELQDITLAGHDLTISGGSTVTLPDLVDDADADATNELQTISLSGSDLTLSNGGGTVTLPAGGSSLWSQTGSDIYRSSGKVGIGLNSPESLFHLYGGTQLIEGTTGIAPSLHFKRGSSIFKIYVNTNEDLVFESDGSPTNKLVFNKDGKIGVNTSNPTALLHTFGTGAGQGNILFAGEVNEAIPGDPPISGAGTRLMWYPGKAAFRAGHVYGNEWNANNIGYYTTAMGVSTAASGNYSLAMGVHTTASGYSSTAIGNYTSASGEYSTVMGQNTVASGLCSTAMGSYTNATGDCSTAMGYNNRASSAYSTVFGANNTDGGNATTWIATDPLFEIGNGTSANDRHNALTVLKNGRVGIGTSNPSYKLDVIGNIRATGSVFYEGTEGTADGLPYVKPDFVFEDDYTWLKIEEVERFLLEKKHLPWVTSAKQEKKENDGAIDMTRMAFETLESVENVQLQLIIQDKQIKELKAENYRLKADNEQIKIKDEQLEARLEKIESMIGLKAGK